MQTHAGSTISPQSVVSTIESFGRRFKGPGVQQGCLGKGDVDLQGHGSTSSASHFFGLDCKFPLYTKELESSRKVRAGIPVQASQTGSRMTRLSNFQIP